MQKIMVIGCSGSGKSTLSRKLADKLDLPLVHLDVLNWRDNWVSVSREEFDRLLAEELEKPRWIMDGNYGRTIEMRLAKCDTVIWLDYSRWVCLTGVLGRVLRSYGKTRSDMGGNCPERFDWDFLKFVWTFRRTHRPKYHGWLAGATHARVVILKNRRQAARFLQTL